MECGRINSADIAATPTITTTATSPGSMTASPPSSELELECDLLVRMAGPVLTVDLQCQGGRTGKDGAHQLLQYLKNKQQRGIK